MACRLCEYPVSTPVTGVKASALHWSDVNAVMQDLVMRTWPRGRNADYVARVLKAAQEGQWILVVRAIRAAADRVGPCPCCL